MDTIDISQNIEDFKQVFENESRIIFSAKFGGKRLRVYTL